MPANSYDAGRLNLPFVGICTFGKSPYQPDWDSIDADVAVLGAPFDFGTQWRPGARFGPRGVREASTLFSFGHGGAYDHEDDVTYLPADKVRIAAGMGYLNHIFGAYLSTLLDEHSDQMTTYARKFAEDGRGSKAVDFVHSLEVVDEMYETFGPMMEKHDIFICPTNALPAVPADFDQTTGKVEINGKEVSPSLGWVMTTPFNMPSHCPVPSVPSGRATKGVPTGIQIVGRSYSDPDVFRAATAYETALGGWYGDRASRPTLQAIPMARVPARAVAQAGHAASSRARLMGQAGNGEQGDQG